MDLRLIHSSSFPIARYSDVLLQIPVRPLAVDNLGELPAADDRLSVILLDKQLASGAAMPPSRHTAIVGVGLNGTSSDDVYMHLPADPPAALFLSAIRHAYRNLYEIVRNEELERELIQRSQELEEINKIGIALSTVRDHDVLLELILTKARELSRSDAGSLYLLDENPQEGKVLRWKLAQNDSIAVDFEERTLKITKQSLAGYVALTGETLVIDDAYELGSEVEYTINRSFDEQTGYLTKSMLVLPMTNHVGDLIGVLQLINRKRPGAPSKLDAHLVPAEVVPFDEQTIKLMRSLGGQAAVAVENNILYDSIERLFEGFVTASVTAIEQRDPTTSGHSFRVADLTVEIAKILDRAADGPFVQVRFTPEQVREIRYASLLHDFGKVGVREKVLVKEKKLYPAEIDIIRARFDFIIRSVEAEAEKKKLDYVMKHGLDGFEASAKMIDDEMQREIASLEADFVFVQQSNEPTVLPEGEFQHLQLLGAREYFDIRGVKRLLLSPEEVKTLSIRKGNLDAFERGEIESHVTHTFRFLSKIPWTKDLRSVPDIAYAHHEKLNGRGYPRKLGAAEIPLQSRMMTVSDIYDALTATDRPYKRAITTDRAIDILRMEVKDGLLDSQLVDVFVEAKIYERAGVVRV